MASKRILERTIARLRKRLPGRAALPDPAFRASVEERLRGLERQLEEVKGRVNGLIFLLAGAVAAEFVMRSFG